MATEAASGEGVAVAVRGLRVDLPLSGKDVVSDVGFTILKGRVLGIVGESGSGKTTVGMALLGFARGGARIAGGSVLIGGDPERNIVAMDESEQRRLRGKAVAYVPQDPAAALNPSLRIRRQLSEIIEAHEPDTAEADIERRITAVMGDVGLPADEAFLQRFPHQLSGGQQQRIGIAMAVIMRPQLIVLDEPTTGLDVTTQNRILDIIQRLCREHGIGAVHVTHDLSVIAHIADEVMVMYAGRVVELGSVEEVLKRPRHPYTQALLGAVPELRYRTHLATIPGNAPGPRSRPAGCFFHPRCALAVAECRSEPIALTELPSGRQVRCIRSSEIATPKPERLPDPHPAAAEPVLSVRGMQVSYGSHPVLQGVDLTLHKGECLAIVGESGSGKSTLSRAIIGLIPGQQSRIELGGEVVAPTARARRKEQLRAMQYIFQSPHNSLNPRHKVEALIGLVHDAFSAARGAARTGAILDVLRQVGLPSETLHAFPDELSGGERQRVAIARALMADPEVLVCDEITSALDVSVQAAIINLIKELQATRKLSLLFVTHNLALVRSLADRVLVLDQGKVVELGATAEVVDAPRHAYTKQLLANALEADLDTRAGFVRVAAQ